MQLVGDELVILRRDCVEGIVACEDRCPAEAESSIALSRVLATIFGYPEGVKVAHYCEEHGVTVKEAVLAMGLLNEADADRLIDPILMTDPEAMARAIAEFRARIDIRLRRRPCVRPLRRGAASLSGGASFFLEVPNGTSVLEIRHRSNRVRENLHFSLAYRRRALLQAP